MYTKSDYAQLSVYDFILPFGGHLDEDNRWVKLRSAIDWKIIEEVYEKNFDNKKDGQEAYPAEVAFGALYIQRTLGCTDRELVMQISENPYMQYFIGYKEYSKEKPFDPSLLVHLRKRLTDEMMSEITERMFLKDKNDDDSNGDSGSGGTREQSLSETEDADENRGTVIIDATCTPADIAFPTDLELCDKARRWTEQIIDKLWETHGIIEGTKKKPRTYRDKARKRFLSVNKRRKKSTKKIKKELRYQLNCIKRNLENIETYGLAVGYDALSMTELDRLLTIYEFYDQQKYLLDHKTHSVPNRIVSLSQPWVRPIVRGKSKAPTEFGAKLSIAVVDGYTFIDKISFDSYNEGDHREFVAAIENYKERFGYYPKRVLADKIYRSQANRNYCKERGIKISGPRLGRPGKNRPEEIRQELREIGERNAVEGKFGNGKRKLGLGRIMAKLKETTGSMIAMDLFVLNMEYHMRKCVTLCYAIIEMLFKGDKVVDENRKSMLTIMLVA